MVQVADAARIPSCYGCDVGRWLQLRLDPYPGNLHMLWERLKKRQKDKTNEKQTNKQTEKEFAWVLLMSWACDRPLRGS